MTDTKQSLRRPGWGMSQDIRPRQVPRSVVLKQPESRPKPAATSVLHDQPQKPADKASNNRRIIQWTRRHILILSAPLLILVGMGLSSIPVVGQIIICAYGLVAIIRRVPSSVSFWLATVLLAGIGLEFLLLPQLGRINNSALFVFLLLVIGFISVTLETRRMIHREKAFRVDNTTAILPGKTRG